MFKLLPSEYKKNLEHDYLVRVAVTGLGFVCLVFVIAAVSLIPSFLLSRVRGQAITKHLESIQGGGKDKEDLQVIVQKTRDDLARLKLADRVSAVKLLDKVRARRVEGISIQAMTLSRSDSPTLIIAGQAGTRDNLISFKKSLESETAFTKIDLPISNLAKSKDIAFTITLQGNF